MEHLLQLLKWVLSPFIHFVRWFRKIYWGAHSRHPIERWYYRIIGLFAMFVFAFSLVILESILSIPAYLREPSLAEGIDYFLFWRLCCNRRIPRYY